ncbi:MAG: hypothetical protein J6Y02_19470 [Pseudobutyrivibrio sp.]|nr:hypothetical protein [Pseudobutyrivibrio sp.]
MISDDVLWYSDVLVCDIDDTLIYGEMVDFMDLMWRIFKSPLLAKLLSRLQAKFKLYRVKYKVAELIVQFLINKKEVYLLTARGFDTSTTDMINDIIPVDGPLKIISLGSYNPSRDKYEWMQSKFTNKDILFIDDNLKTRLKCMELHKVNAIHPGDV